MILDSPTLASLRFFEAVARLLSFKRAALELNITQGAVSQQIKHLERVLGCSLFHRLPRHIVLTEEGSRFAVAVSQALDDICVAADAISSASARDIRVRVGPSLALRWLVPRLGDFYARHPNIKLTIMAGYGYFDPSRREFDIAIDTAVDQLSAMPSELLMDEYLVPVCSPEYLESHAFLKEPADLANCVLLHDSHAWAGADRDAEWRHWLSETGAAQVDTCGGQFYTLSYMSIEAALNHQGVALGRAALLGDLLDTGRLVAPIRRPVKSRVKYWVIWPPDSEDRQDLATFREWLRSNIRSGFPAPGGTDSI